jgi:quercetin dioxygenase-like cupin family protein
MQTPRTPAARLAALLLAAVPLPVIGAPPIDHGVIKPLAAAELGPDADVKCLKSALEAGNPDQGPSTFLLTAAPGCEVTAHYHTAGEQLIIVRGQVLTGMDGMTATVLGPGGFASMPGKAVHWFTCQSKTPCTMFVLFDGVYDIVWVKKGA